MSHSPFRDVYPLTYRHMTWFEAEPLGILPDEYEAFTIIREPYDRLRSLWWHNFRRGYTDYHLNKFWWETLKAPVHSNRVAYGARTSTRQSDFVYPGMKIFHTDKMEQVSEFLGKEIHKSRINAHPTPPLEYAPIVKQAIENHFAEDFELYAST